MSVQVGDNATAEGIPLAEVVQIINPSGEDERHPDIEVAVLEYEQGGDVKQIRRPVEDLTKPADRQDEDPLGG